MYDGGHIRDEDRISVEKGEWGWVRKGADVRYCSYDPDQNAAGCAEEEGRGVGGECGAEPVIRSSARHRSSTYRDEDELQHASRISIVIVIYALRRRNSYPGDKSRNPRSSAGSQQPLRRSAPSPPIACTISSPPRHISLLILHYPPRFRLPAIASDSWYPVPPYRLYNIKPTLAIFPLHSPPSPVPHFPFTDLTSSPHSDHDFNINTPHRTPIPLITYSSLYDLARRHSHPDHPFHSASSFSFSPVLSTLDAVVLRSLAR